MNGLVGSIAVLVGLAAAGPSWLVAALVVVTHNIPSARTLGDELALLDRERAGNGPQDVGDALLERGPLRERLQLEPDTREGLQHAVVQVARGMDVAELIPREVAHNHKVVPVSRLENKLFVAMVDPLNVLALDDIRRLTKLEVSPFITSEKAILDKLAAIEANKGASMEDIILDAQKQEGEEENVEITKEQIAAAIKEYHSMTNKEGLGCVFVAECLDNIDKVGSYYMTFFDIATRSAGEFAALAAGTTRMLSVVMMLATGSKSFTASYGSFDGRLGLIACEVLVPRKSV